MKKILLLFLFAFISTLVVFIYQLFLFKDGKLHVVFCNVGQGDAIFVTTPQSSKFLIDGGPNNKVLDCMAAHMPFWERKLDLVFMTHPHEDHLYGLLAVLKRYRVMEFVSSGLKNNTSSYKKLNTIISSEKIPSLTVKKGDAFTIGDGVTVKILGPSQKFLSTTSPTLQIGERLEFANLVIEITYRTTTVLLTGDSQADGLTDALEHTTVKPDILQIPHHGSKTGLSSKVLDRLEPRLGVISVGHNNRYGHPNSVTLALLKRKEVEIKRTDVDGEQEFISDGKEIILNQK